LSISSGFRSGSNLVFEEVQDAYACRLCSSGEADALYEDEKDDWRFFRDK